MLPGLVAACGIGNAFAPAQDDLSSWQRVPLPPARDLDEGAAKAGTCRIDVPDGVPIDILIQDRRTESTAAFLVRGPTTVGSCLWSTNGGGAGGGSQPAQQLRPLGNAVLSVDEEGSGGVGDGQAAILGGRVAPGVAAVQVHVADDLVVDASVANGYWLSWWPGEVRATRIVAAGAQGEEFGVFTLGPQGWSAT